MAEHCNHMVIVDFYVKKACDTLRSLGNENISVDFVETEDGEVIRLDFINNLTDEIVCSIEPVKPNDMN